MKSVKKIKLEPEYSYIDGGIKYLNKHFGEIKYLYAESGIFLSDFAWRLIEDVPEKKPTMMEIFSQDVGEDVRKAKHAIHKVLFDLIKSCPGDEIFIMGYNTDIEVFPANMTGFGMPLHKKLNQVYCSLVVCLAAR
jgi:hypothetical protein